MHGLGPASAGDGESWLSVGCGRAGGQETCTVGRAFDPIRATRIPLPPRRRPSLAAPPGVVACRVAVLYPTVLPADAPEPTGAAAGLDRSCKIRRNGFRRAREKTCSDAVSRRSPCR